MGGGDGIADSLGARGAGGAAVDAGGALPSDGLREDLLEEAGDAFRGEARVGGQGAHAGEEGVFAGGVAHGACRAGLQRADLVDDGLALGKKRHELAVEGIDAGAGVVQGRGHGGGVGRA